MWVDFIQSIEDLNRRKRLSKMKLGASLVTQLVKNLPAMWERTGFNPWVGKMPWTSEDQVSSSVSLSHQEPSINLLSLSIRGQTE